MSEYEHMELKPNRFMFTAQLTVVIAVCLSVPLMVAYFLVTKPQSTITDDFWQILLICFICLASLPFGISQVLCQYKIRLTKEGATFPSILGEKFLRWADVEKAELLSWHHVYLLFHLKSGKSATITLDLYADSEKLFRTIEQWLPVPIRDEYNFVAKLKGK